MRKPVAWVGVALIAAIALATCALQHRDEVAPPSEPSTTQPSDDSAAPRVRATLPPPPQEGATPDAPTVEESRRPVAADESTPSNTRVAQPEHTLRGRVVDADGRPLRDAEVSLVSCWLPSELVRERAAVLDHVYAGTGYSWDEWSFPRLESNAVTGEDGTFALRYREGGERTLRVGRRGRADVVIVGVSDDRFHEVRIPSARCSVSVVVHAPDGSDVAGAYVVLSQAELPVVRGGLWGCGAGHVNPTVGWNSELDAISDDQGRCAFRNLAVGSATLEVIAPGFAPALDVPCRVTERTNEVVVQLEHGFTLTGRVVDVATAAPVAGAAVLLDEDAQSDESRSQTDVDGCFRIDHVPGAARSFRTIRVRARGYADEQVLTGFTDEASRVCHVVIELCRPASVAARCLDEHGAPVDRAIVVVRSGYAVARKVGDIVPPRMTFEDQHSADTDATGRAVVVCLHAGGGPDLAVTVYRDGVPVLERSYPPLMPAETRDLGDVVLASTLSLTGTVLDADGQPVAGATVVAAPSDPEDADHAAIGAAVMERGGRRAETRPDGTFSLVGLGKGLWDLYASSDWNAPGKLEYGVDPSRGTVELRLPRVVALTGRVVDANGSPVAKARVVSFRTFFGMRMEVSCLAADDGRFVIPGYAEGTPEVEVTVTPREGADAQAFKARPGAAGTELRLR